MNVLITEPLDFSKKAIEKLKNFSIVELGYDENKTYDHIDILFIRLGYKIDEQFLINFKKVKIIVSPTTGEDHIDIEYINKNDIKLLSLKGHEDFLSSIPATAELTIGLIINLSRNITSAHNGYLKKNIDRDNYKGFDLKNKKLSLIGFGRVAKLVSKYALSFGMHVQAYDPYADFNEYRFVKKFNSLEAILIDSDFISIHAALNQETLNLLNKKLLKTIDEKTFLINTSRGDIIDNEYLLSMLKNNKIKGAALDVIANELDKENKIRNEFIGYANRNKNVILTPHIGGATYESMESTELFLTDKLVEMFGV